MTRRDAIRAAGLLAAGCLVAILGCGDDVSSGKDWQVSSQQNSFQFQVTDMKNYSRTLTYPWPNDGTAASVNQACSISDGAATVTLRDNAGTVVYSRSLRENGTFNTSTGTAGTWSVTISMQQTTGTLNVRAQKL